MAKGRTNLAVVKENHLQSLQEVEEFAGTLSDAHLLCREMGHNWRPHTVGRYRDGGFQRTLRCPRCKTKKVQELSSRGMIIGGARYIHPEGYLHKGMGQIVGEGRGVLRVASILRSAQIKDIDS